MNDALLDGEQDQPRILLESKLIHYSVRVEGDGSGRRP
jgi:hypothetical protein